MHQIDLGIVVWKEKEGDWFTIEGDEELFCDEPILGLDELPKDKILHVWLVPDESSPFELVRNNLGWRWRWNGDSDAIDISVLWSGLENMLNNQAAKPGHYTLEWEEADA